MCNPAMPAKGDAGQLIHCSALLQPREHDPDREPGNQLSSLAERLTQAGWKIYGTRLRRAATPPLSVTLPGHD